MKNLNQLYTILYDYIRCKPAILSVCGEILNIYYLDRITIDEYMLLDEHFKSQRPTENKHVEFYECETYKKDQTSLFWWTFAEVTNPENKKAFVKYLSEQLWDLDMS